MHACMNTCICTASKPPAKPLGSFRAGSGSLRRARAVAGALLGRRCQGLLSGSHIHIHMHVHICMPVHVYTCVDIYIYMYIYTLYIIENTYT